MSLNLFLHFASHKNDRQLWLQAKSVPWLPNMVLGVIAFVVGLTCLLLPETKDWPALPMSIAEVYRFSKGDFGPAKPDDRKEKEKFISEDAW